MIRYLVAGAAAAALLFSTAAEAAVSVWGDSLARACYEAARDGRADAVGVSRCDQALDDQFLSRRDRAASLVNRGIVRMHRQEWAIALADFDTAVRLMPEMGEAHVNRGAALIMQRQYQPAITAITHGLTLNPQDAHEAHFNRAIAYEELGDLRSAYNDLRRSTELAPEWPRAHLELARFHVTPAN